MVRARERVRWRPPISDRHHAIMIVQRARSQAPGWNAVSWCIQAEAPRFSRRHGPSADESSADTACSGCRGPNRLARNRGGGMGESCAATSRRPHEQFCGGKSSCPLPCRASRRGELLSVRSVLARSPCPFASAARCRVRQVFWAGEWVNLSGGLEPERFREQGDSGQLNHRRPSSTTCSTAVWLGLLAKFVHACQVARKGACGYILAHGRVLEVRGAGD
jgi:hypothetical protein